MQDNRTIVRSFNGSGSSWLIGGIQALCRHAPKTMARIATGLFLRPMRRPGKERGLDLASAEPFVFHSEGKRLKGWTWGQGPLVVLVHGWAGCGAQMAHLAQALAANGFRAIVFDAPGHGSSAGSSSSLPQMAWAIRDLGRRMGPVHALVAHSLGASATLHALDKGLTAERVVLLAPATDITHLAYFYMSKLGFSNRVLQLMQARIEERFAVRWDEFEGRVLAPRMRQHLLLLHDRRDRQVPWEQGEAMAEAWPGARLITTQGQGHLRILRALDVLNQVVSFLQQGLKEAALPSDVEANLLPQPEE